MEIVGNFQMTPIEISFLLSKHRKDCAEISFNYTRSILRHATLMLSSASDLGHFFTDPDPDPYNEKINKNTSFVFSMT